MAAVGARIRPEKDHFSLEISNSILRRAIAFSGDLTGFKGVSQVSYVQITVTQAERRRGHDRKQSW